MEAEERDRPQVWGKVRTTVSGLLAGQTPSAGETESITFPLWLCLCLSNSLPLTSYLRVFSAAPSACKTLCVVLSVSPAGSCLSETTHILGQQIQLTCWVIVASKICQVAHVSAKLSHHHTSEKHLCRQVVTWINCLWNYVTKLYSLSVDILAFMLAENQHLERGGHGSSFLFVPLKGFFTHRAVATSKNWCLFYSFKTVFP